MNNNNINPQEILKNLQNKNLNSSVDQSDVNKLLNGLTPEQRAKLNKILADKTATEQILASPKAQQLLKALFKGGNGNG